MKKHLEVVAGIIIGNKGILCMQRDIGKYQYVSLKWEFPGGKIEQSETKESALVRELKEEMNMKVDIVKHYIDVNYEYPDFTITMYCYLCKTDDDSFVMNVHRDYKWMQIDNIDLLDWAPADIAIVEELKRRRI